MAYNPRDSYYRKAKDEGYRSRAAYKLVELQQRFRLLKNGDFVVDLGAAPGGWLQVAAKIVGPGGRVIGVDLQPIAAFHERNVQIIQADISAGATPAAIAALLGGPAHCVISDLAPKLSGIRDADVARCLELNEIALRAAVTMLRPGGNLLIKSFVSNELKSFTLRIKEHFHVVERTRPDATRQGSSEFYFCAKGFIEAPGEDRSH